MTEVKKGHPTGVSSVRSGGKRPGAGRRPGFKNPNAGRRRILFTIRQGEPVTVKNVHFGATEIGPSAQFHVKEIKGDTLILVEQWADGTPTGREIKIKKGTDK